MIGQSNNYLLYDQFFSNASKSLKEGNFYFIGVLCFTQQVSADGHINAWDCSVDASGLIPQQDLFTAKAKNTEEDDIPLPEEEENATTKEPKEESVY